MTAEQNEKQLNQALLSLGSNIEPERNLPAAVRLLSGYGTVRKASAVWETLPYGYAGQQNFLNAAVWLETPLSAAELKENAIAAIEISLGRVRSDNRNAPRTIDIDIIFFNSDIIRNGTRRIPDPEVMERPYVAIPLAEIAPRYRHPETGQTMAEIGEKFALNISEMRRRNDVLLVNYSHRNS